MTEVEPPGAADDEGDPADASVELSPIDPPIEPGHPSLEHAVFVLLGVAVAIGVVFRLVQLFG